MRLRRFVCMLRFGHRWQTSTDPSGSVTFCTRCDKVRRGRGRSDPDEYVTLDTTPGAFGARTDSRLGTPPAERR